VLGAHPERDLITRRYLRHQHSLAAAALMRLDAEEAVSGAIDDGEDALETPIRLNGLRLDAVAAELEACGAATVLDLGCGEGRHAFEAYRRGAHVVAVDWGVPEVETTKRWLGAIAEAGEAPAGGCYEVVRGDLLHLPFPDASVDRVMASEVLEHIPDDVTAMAEIARVLRPGGRVAVTVPRYGPERICWALSDEYHANEGGHIRIYRGGVLRDRLASVGLVPGRTHHAHSLHAPFWWLKCAVGVEKDNAAVRGYHRLLVWDLMYWP